MFVWYREKVRVAQMLFCPTCANILVISRQAYAVDILLSGKHISMVLAIQAITSGHATHVHMSFRYRNRSTHGHTSVDLF